MVVEQIGPSAILAKAWKQADNARRVPAHCRPLPSTMPIRLVTFDALLTLVRPRQPVYVQYAQIFEPYLGALAPDAIKRSFKSGMSHSSIPRVLYLDVRWQGMQR